MELIGGDEELKLNPVAQQQGWGTGCSCHERRTPMSVADIAL